MMSREKHKGGKEKLNFAISRLDIVQLLNGGGLKHPKQVSVYLPMTECNLISEQGSISRSCKLILQQASSKKNLEEKSIYNTR